MFKGNKLAEKYYNFFKFLRPYKLLITIFNVFVATNVWIRWSLGWTK